MNGISFWSKGTHSGRIRGKQMADYLGAKRNPVCGFDDDICVFVKTTPAIIKCRKIFIDPVDAPRYVKVASECSEWGVIAISKVAYEYLTGMMKNDVVFIPQHHCNYDRKKRPDRPIKVVGFCGEYHTFEPFEKEIRERLAKIGIELSFKYSYRGHRDVAAFYEGIDIQIIWRVSPGYIENLKNPLKLSNAGSFGIPTVAIPEPNFVREYDGCFLTANSIPEMICLVEQLSREPGLYNHYSVLASNKAEQYHISRIAEMYKGLVE